MRSVSVLLFICLLLSCDNKTKLGQYVYEDDMDVLHTDENCSKLKDGKDDEGHPIYAMQPIDIAQLAYCGKVCSQCVSKNTYEQLKNIVEKNSKKVQRERFKNSGNNRKWLYRLLERGEDPIQEQYIVEMPSYEEFEKEMSDPIFRRNVYDMIEERSYHYGQHRILDYNSYEDFSRLMGYDEQ